MNRDAVRNHLDRPPKRVPNQDGPAASKAALTPDTTELGRTA